MKKNRTMRYEIAIGKNGMKYVLPETCDNNTLNVSFENSKLGRCLNIGFPIELTCVHDCSCYTEKICYGSSGCFVFGDNQANYTENYNFFMSHSIDEIVNALNDIIKESGLANFRFLEVGDILNLKMLKVFIQTATDNPFVNFWCYTKKYRLVNLYCEKYGLETIPDNFVIIFSHWMNKDGTYYPMDNSFNFPTS